MARLTGFNVFLISESRVPPFRAMISGAASGSWAIGEPHSEQKIRWTALPEEPFPAQLLVGPLMVSLSFGTTTTRASQSQQDVGKELPRRSFIRKRSSTLSAADRPVIGFYSQ